MPKLKDKSPPLRIELPTKKTLMGKRFKDYISMFFGPPGVGKTTFVNDLGDNVLFLSTDRGSRHLKANRVECMTWKHFLATLDSLEEKGAPHYDIICIDHVDDMVNMLEDYLLKKLKVESLTDRSLPWGKGWKLFKNGISDLIRRIMRLNTGVVFICHERVTTVKLAGVEKQQYQPDMTKTAWKILLPIADIVGFIHVEVARDKQTKKRVKRRRLVTQPDDEIYAKDRTARNKPADGSEPLDPEKFLATFGERHGKASSEEGDEGSEQEEGQARGGSRGRGRIGRHGNR